MPLRGTDFHPAQLAIQSCSADAQQPSRIVLVILGDTQCMADLQITLLTEKSLEIQGLSR